MTRTYDPPATGVRVADAPPRRRRRLATAMSILVVGGVCVAGVAGLNAFRDDDGAQASGDGTVLAVANEGSAVTSWAKTAAAFVVTLGDDTEAMSVAASHNDVTALAAACTTFSTDVATARERLLPAPDADVNASMTKALDLYRKAGLACTAAARDNSAADLREASADLKQAAVYVAKIRKNLTQ